MIYNDENQILRLVGDSLLILLFVSKFHAPWTSSRRRVDEHRTVNIRNRDNHNHKKWILIFFLLYKKKMNTSKCPWFARTNPRFQPLFFFILSFYGESNCTWLSQYHNFDTAIAVAPLMTYAPSRDGRWPSLHSPLGNPRAGIGLFYSNFIFLFSMSRS